jgi:hypothetical protein
MLSDLNSVEPLRTPIAELDGASAVINAFATFGLQRSLDSNELLRALLFGQERLPDAAILKQLWNKSATSYPCSACSSCDDPKLVNGTLTSRLTSTFNEISTVMAQIANGSRRESSRAVDNVLRAARVQLEVEAAVHPPVRIESGC